MNEIYFDESGFTGYNYLDPDQPAFVIASTDLDPIVSQDILSHSFPKYNGKEYKFTNIAGSSNEPGLVEFGRLLKPHTDRFFIYMIDKKFATLVKAVDFLIEPATTAAGYDFYYDGFGRKYANYIYIGMNIIDKIGAYDELTAAYQVFSRNPSKTELVRLADKIKVMYSKAGLEMKKIFREFIHGCKILEYHVDLSNFKETNDLQLTSMVASIAYWRQHLLEDFKVIHDDSSNFMRRREMWDALTSPDVEEFLHPLGGGDGVMFPLRVLETVSVKSEDCASVQLCDMVAGFATQNFRDKQRGIEKQVYIDALENGLGKLTFNGIRPGTEFPTFPPVRRKGPDIIDKMSSIIAKKKKS